jgi:hypothetical protein
VPPTRRTAASGREREELVFETTSDAFAGALLLLLSVFINGRGAFSPDTAKWNDYPLNVDKRPERLWDWRYPQFAAGLVATPLPQADKDFPLLNRASILVRPKRINIYGMVGAAARRF